jgi:hypothetical protein
MRPHTKKEEEMYVKILFKNSLLRMEFVEKNSFVTDEL